MSALQWLRDHAEKKDTDIIEVEGKQIETTFYAFEGRIPFSMIAQLRRERCQAVKTDAVQENLFLGGQYRSDANLCRFYRTEYTQTGRG